MSRDVRVAVLSFLDRQSEGVRHSADSIAEMLGLGPESVNAYLAAGVHANEIQVDASGQVTLHPRLRGQFKSVKNLLPTPARVGHWNAASNWERVVLVVGSVIFLVVLLLYAVFSKGDLPDQQFSIVRTISALAGAGFGMVIPGFFQVEIRIANSLWLRAIGAVAIFAVIYFFMPAM